MGPKEPEEVRNEARAIRFTYCMAVYHRGERELGQSVSSRVGSIESRASSNQIDVLNVEYFDHQIRECERARAR